ncbi:MAG: NAD/NADP octopine/nopaline dehydrogenase family protein [Candidatus Latescibacteria bacterium]|nr:NAD/NADP octopine/nopaline dehydrogenase family protein [Candidatus Latescibacterota bacterium]
MYEPIRSHTCRNQLGQILRQRGLDPETFCARTGIDLALCRDDRRLPDITAMEALGRALPDLDPTSLVVFDPEEAPPALQVTLWGCGNLGHVLAGLLSARPDLRVHVRVSTADKVQRLQQGMEAQGGIAVRRREGTVVGRPHLVTTDPAQAVSGSQLILLCVPALVHAEALQQLLPHVAPGAWVGAVPAPGGFDWKVRWLLGARAQQVGIFGVGVIPWMCKVRAYGQEVEVLGRKILNGVVALPGARTGKIADLLAGLLGMPFLDLRTFLNIALIPGNPFLHPAIMWDLFSDWDGRPLAEAPLFYEGLSQRAADLLQALSGELLALRAALEAQLPGLRLSAVLPLDLSIRLGYGADVADPSSLRTIIATNRAYAGLRAPMVKVEGGWAPDWNSRFFWEDVPHGLVMLRGLADLAGVPTPALDRLLVWAQERMGREYLRDGRLEGRDLASASVPAQYGITGLAGLGGADPC